MSKVLLIDSDSAASSTLSQFLTANGYKVTAVGDGRSALVHLKQQRADIILMAAELPQANGYALCNRLKKDQTAANIPLVIFSASANAEATFAKHQALPTHADLYLKKPIKLEILLAQMRDLLTADHDNPNMAKTQRLNAPSASTTRAEGNTTIYKIPDEILQRAKEPESTRLASIPHPQTFEDECTVSANKNSPLMENEISKAQLITLKKELNEAESQLAEKDEQYSVAVERLEKLAEKAKALMAERDDLKNRLNELNNTLKRERALAESSKAEFQAAIDTNKEQIRSYQEEVTGLESRLELERQREAKAQQALQLAMQIIQDAGLMEE